MHIDLNEPRTLADWIEIRRQAHEVARFADGVISNLMRKELKAPVPAKPNDQP